MVLKGSSLCVKSSSNSVRALPRVFNRVILGVKTCEVFLCVQAIIFKWLLCIILSFSVTREFHTEYEPFNHPFSLIQITVKTSRTLFSLLQLEVSLEHRLVVEGELFHGGGGTLGFAARTLGTQLSLYQSLGQLNFAILYWTKLPKSPPVLE